MKEYPMALQRVDSQPELGFVYDGIKVNVLTHFFRPDALLYKNGDVVSAVNWLESEKERIESDESRMAQIFRDKRDHLALYVGKR